MLEKAETIEKVFILIENLNEYKFTAINSPIQPFSEETICKL